MPKGLSASTGMDALTHAIEGYTTRAAWELADCLNLEAIRLISKNLRAAVANEAEGREGMALGQFVTGMAFSNVGLGIAHSIAHTLGCLLYTSISSRKPARTSSMTRTVPLSVQSLRTLCQKPSAGSVLSAKFPCIYGCPITAAISPLCSANTRSTAAMSFHGR